MKAEYVGKEKNVITFTMDFSAEEFDASCTKAFNNMRGRIEIDGFRKGKAPRSIIEKKFGEGIFFEEAINSLLEENYPKALTDLDIDPIDQPEMEFGEEKIEKGKGFKVTVKVPVAPEVEVKDYKGIKAERKIHVVKDSEIEDELKAMQKRNARLVTVEREAKNGDTVILDYKGFVGEDQFDGGTADMQSLELGSGTFIPGFEDQLVGTKAGDDKDVVVTFPEEYGAEDLAGKEAVFKCHVHEVKEEVLPELNDDFVQDVSEELNTLEELKEDIRKRLNKAAADVAEYNGKNAVMEKMYESTTIDLPEIMIKDEEEQMLQEFQQELSYQGIGLDMYCQYLGKTKDEIKEEFAPNAEMRVKSRLIADAVAKAEGIEATEEDIEKEMSEMAKQYGMEVEKLKEMFNPENLVYLKADIKNRKAIEFMYENAVFTDVEEKAAETEE